MAPPAPPSEKSPLALKLFHTAVFAGFVAATLSVAWPELAHLVRALQRPLHHGDPPLPLSLLAATLAGVALARLLFDLFRRRSSPLWASVAILVAGALAVISLSSPLPQQRTAPGANLQLLSSAQKLQKVMVSRLQEQGEITRALSAWEEALREVAPPGQSVVRDRLFGRVPYRLVEVTAAEGLPEAPIPGQIALWISEDSAAFTLRPIGFDPGGRAWPLEDGEAKPLLLRGTYNPEALEEPAPPPGGQGLQPLIRP